MARVLILGAGVAGHTAAQYSRKLLGKEHEVTVVSPNSQWNWIPSNIWVGVGKMGKKQVVFPLAPVYKRIGVDFHQAKAVAVCQKATKTTRREQSTSSTPTPRARVKPASFAMTSSSMPLALS